MSKNSVIDAQKDLHLSIQDEIDKCKDFIYFYNNYIEIKVNGIKQPKRQISKDYLKLLENVSIRKTNTSI